ncbi:MAG: hypothetical protein K6G61_08700 [Solobacterium sp.]|nr:hypothetical protein [Solobacterium sp.]
MKIATMDIVMFVTICWIPFMIAYMLINETKFKKNIVIGVTLPNEAHDDPEVNRITDTFKKQTWGVCIALTVLFLLMLVVPNKMKMTMWMIGIELTIICPYIPYIFSRRKLLDLKNERGWVQEKRIVTVNTSALSSQKWLSAWLFVPPVILCLVPILFDRDFMFIYILLAVMCASFWAGYRYLYRNKAEMVDENIELTKALSQIRKYNWGKMWLVTSYAMAAYCLTMALMEKTAVFGFAAMILITVFVCYAALRIEMRTRKIQENLTRNSGSEWYVDDDDKWIGGILYFNPDDSRWVINSRIGTNSSVNIATVPGKIMMVLLVLLMLGLPFMGVFMDSLGSQPIEMAVTEETVTVKSGMKTYTVEKDDIAETELLAELPALRRKWGTGMDTYLEGKFSSDSMGAVNVMLDPTQGPFILIKTEDGAYYLFGTRDQQNTIGMYEQISN